MTQLIFWARQIGGPPSYKPCEQSHAQEVLETAFSLGIRTYDTAPIYGLWRSESILWEILSSQRKEIHLISKFWFDWGDDGKTYFDFSSDGIRKQLEKSLKRLKTDYLDTYLLHIPQSELPVEEILSELNLLKKEWMIHHYGVCNMYLKQLQDVLSHPLCEVEYVQDFYNILERKAENLIFPFLKPDIQFMAYGPLYRGVMTPLSMKELLEKDEDAINRLMKNTSLLPLYRKKQLYEKVSQKTGLSLEKIAINFLDHNPRVDAIIFGTKNAEHLKSFMHFFNL